MLVQKAWTKSWSTTLTFQEKLRTLDFTSWGVFPRRGSVIGSDSVVSISFSAVLSVSVLQGLLFIAFEAILASCMIHACCERKISQSLTRRIYTKNRWPIDKEQDQTNYQISSHSHTQLNKINLPGQWHIQQQCPSQVQQFLEVAAKSRTPHMSI